MRPSHRLSLGTLCAMLLSAISITRARGQDAPSATAPISQDELVRRLTTYLDSLSAIDQFSGLVVVAPTGRGTPIFQRAYGMADRATRRPNNFETAFNLGSINKVFTATAIRQLAAAGKIDLDSTLAKYLPDYPNQNVARRITIRQLLQMRSGIGGDIFGTPASGDRHSIRTNGDYLPLFVNEAMLFEPGTDQRYSNAGFVVLGLVIERVSGERYYDYVRRHIYEPAGMTRTAHYAVDSLPPNTAIGYTRGGENAPPNATLRPNTAMLPGRGSAAGGGYSTADDLLRFLAAIRANRIPGAPPGGLGVAGGAPGLNAILEGALPGGYDVVVFANLDPPAAMNVGRTIRTWLGARD
jgi:CubicO group peptidase (beta-lactamase class C family)